MDKDTLKKIIEKTEDMLEEDILEKYQDMDEMDAVMETYDDN